MSLINNMLKDLEKRKTHIAPIPYVAYTKEKASVLEFLTRINKFYFIAALMLFVVCMAIVAKNSLRPKDTSLSFVKEASTPSMTHESQEIKWLAPTTITGATLQVKENITELSFLLDHPAFYRLNSDGMSNQFSFIIEHAKLQSELPVASYLNSAIQRITTDSVDGGTRFNITLYPGATIKYVNLHADDKNPEIVIAIEYQPRDIKSKNIPVSSFKSPNMKSILLQEYQRSLKTAEEGDYQGAIKNLSAILKSDPNYKDARVSLAALMIDQGGSAKARKIIDEGLFLAPHYSPFIELKARLLSQDGKIDSAISLLQNSSPSLQENPEYHALIAALYSQVNKDQLAAQLYQQLVQVDGHNGNWWFGLGVSLDKLNQRQSAIDAYSKALNEGHLNGESLAYLQNRLQLLKDESNAKG